MKIAKIQVNLLPIASLVTPTLILGSRGLSSRKTDPVWLQNDRIPITSSIKEAPTYIVLAALQYIFYGYIGNSHKYHCRRTMM
jgi:hypothetical protein